MSSLVSPPNVLTYHLPLPPLPAHASLAPLAVCVHINRLKTFHAKIELERALATEKLNLDDAEKRAHRAAHDFGTPLQALVLATEMIFSDIGDHPFAKSLAAAVSSLVRLRELMMDEARLTLGEALQPRRDTVDPRKFLGEIATIADVQSRAAGIVFTLFVASSPPTTTTRGETGDGRKGAAGATLITMGGGREAAPGVRIERRVEIDLQGSIPRDIDFLPIVADANRMVTIGLNLVSNAVKHANHHIHMVVSVPSANDGDGGDVHGNGDGDGNGENDDGRWRVEIHDDGDGVPSSLESVLFGDNIGARTSAQTHDGSNGIGLYSVKKMCECLGGNCGFGQSPRLGGAMFWFWIPYEPDMIAASVAHEEENKEEGGKSKTSEYGTVVSTTLDTAVDRGDGSLEILLVDDSDMIRMMVKALLERQGCNVTTAENGRDGLREMQARRFSLVISDIQVSAVGGV